MEEKGTRCCTRDPYQWWHYLIRLLLPSNVRALVLFHQNTSSYLDRQLLQSYCNVLKICWRLTVGAQIVMHSNTTVGSVILDNHFCTWQPISLCHDCSNLPRLPAIVISDIYFCASRTISLCCNCSNLPRLPAIVISDIYFCASVYSLLLFQIFIFVHLILYHYAATIQIYQVCLLLLFQIFIFVHLILYHYAVTVQIHQVYLLLLFQIFIFVHLILYHYATTVQICQVYSLLLFQIFIFVHLILYHYAATVQIYQVHLLLLFQMEIGTLIMMRACINLWFKPSSWQTLWVSSSLLTQIYYYIGLYHSDINVLKFI